VIDRLNEEILKLGEGKLSAMQESKEYRSGSLHLRYSSFIRWRATASNSGTEYREGPPSTSCTELREWQPQTQVQSAISTSGTKLREGQPQT
jgi:hypothetical protein